MSNLIESDAIEVNGYKELLIVVLAIIEESEGLQAKLSGKAYIAVHWLRKVLRDIEEAEEKEESADDA